MSEPKRVEGWANVYLDGEGNEYFLALWSSRPNAEAHKSEGAQRLVRVVELRENERIGVNLGLESRPPLIPNDDLRARVEAAIHANDKVEPLGERKRIPLVMGVDPASGKDGAASVSMITWEAHEKVLKERDAAIERAEKAERERDEAARTLRMYRNAWTRELGGNLIMKAGGLLDSLVATTREMREENEKFRAAAGVLCGGHIGVPQSKCPACERDEWRSRALAAESALNDAAGKYERGTAARLWAADISHAMGAPMSWAIESAAKLRSHYFPPAKEVSNG